MENSNQSRRSYWQGHVNNFKASDGNKAAYCREQKINYHQFSYWHGRLGNNDNVVVPVTIRDNPAAASGVLCSITLPNGYQITFHDKSSLSMLK